MVSPKCRVTLLLIIFGHFLATFTSSCWSNQILRLLVRNSRSWRKAIGADAQRPATPKVPPFLIISLSPSLVVHCSSRLAPFRFVTLPEKESKPPLSHNNSSSEMLYSRHSLVTLADSSPIKTLASVGNLINEGR